MIGADPLAHVQQLLYAEREHLPMFTVTERPKDYPGSYVARLWLTLPAPQPTNCILRHADLDVIRNAMIDLGLARLDRSPEDDPAIVETWI